MKFDKVSEPASSACQKHPPSAARRLSLPDLDLIASQTGLIIRRSPKFTPGAFLQTLLGSAATGQASLNQLAAELKDRAEAPMARQSLHQHLGERSSSSGCPTRWWCWCFRWPSTNSAKPRPSCSSASWRSSRRFRVPETKGKTLEEIWQQCS